MTSAAAVVPYSVNTRSASRSSTRYGGGEFAPTGSTTSTQPGADTTRPAVTTWRGATASGAPGGCRMSAALTHASSDESNLTRQNAPPAARPVTCRIVPGHRNHLYVPPGIGRPARTRSVSDCPVPDDMSPIASYRPLSGNGVRAIAESALSTADGRGGKAIAWV